ncbi:MAG: HupE/UreJ family protein [Pseudomonadales bacterium]|nr:HupE/UreJ family protein [Pseudomonadales bacterium]MDP6470522.1 HupE/UreJ family protein [Pseudomonadales bacterium]MDP6827824.1 HupE/UreJ family protein [Pseudomonadales bacterium]MDP6972156.1 HupE/UreJ family protein [Pseudomonadales bacterium]
MTVSARIITAVLLILLPVFGALGHEVRPAYLQIEEVEANRFAVLWKQPILQDRRLPIDPVFPESCTAPGPVTPEVTGAALLQRWIIECPLDSGLIHISGLSRTLTDVMVTIRRLDGSESSTLLRASQPSLDLSDPAPGAGAYLPFGIEHLIFGIDHVLFVIGLVLFISDRWMLLKTITAFTIAHSITLALSVLDLVYVPQGPVEAVIALSILFLARELAMEESKRSFLTRARPWIMAFVFGLLHGFGFAGALNDIGLPREELALALFLFNVGIELGQLMIIAVVFALLWTGRTVTHGIGYGHSAHLVEQAFVWVMGCMAAFWTLDRVLPLI